MNFHRRKILSLAAGAAAVPFLSRTARAQAYPVRPIRWIVPFPPGGAVDVVGRVMGQELSERIGQPVIVENRPGAGGNLGTEAVVRSNADGYTLLQISAPNAINAALPEKLSFDFVRDIVPVASFLRVPGVMVVNQSSPARSVPEFIAYARTNAGALNMASGGIGTPEQVYGELFKMMADVKMLHVPYRGGALAITDLLGGQVHVIFSPIPSVIEHIKSGTLRPLAVTTATRLDILPDVPTVSEFVPGYEASGLQGLGAPRDTSAHIVDTLNKVINAALADARVEARLRALGGSVVVGSPEDLRRSILDEIVKWSRVIKFAGIKPE
jgi:tripartite-type tricarboxylate transporter receptor subunit TctC